VRGKPSPPASSSPDRSYRRHEGFESRPRFLVQWNFTSQRLNLALKPAKEFRNFSLKLIDRREVKRGCVTAEEGKCRLEQACETGARMAFSRRPWCMCGGASASQPGRPQPDVAGRTSAQTRENDTNQPPTGFRVQTFRERSDFRNTGAVQALK
jgi:hypothetical protein